MSNPLAALYDMLGYGPAAAQGDPTITPGGQVIPGGEMTPVQRRATDILGAIYGALNQQAAKVPGAQGAARLGQRGHNSLQAWVDRIPADAPKGGGMGSPRDVRKSREALQNVYDFFVPQDPVGALLAAIPPAKIGKVRGFHGTKKVFDKFERTYDIGFHFGTEAQAAEMAGKSGRVMQASLNIKNPIEMRDLGNWLPNDVVRELRDLAKSGRYPQLTLDAVEQLDEARTAAGWQAAAKGLDTGEPQYRIIRDRLKSLGFDGIKYENLFEGEAARLPFEQSKPGGTAYIVFDSSQVEP